LYQVAYSTLDTDFEDPIGYFPHVAKLDLQPAVEITCESLQPLSKRVSTSRPKYAVTFFNQGVAVGTGFRYQDFLVTAAHVVTTADSWGVPGKVGSVSVSDDEFRYVDGQDVAFMRVKPIVWSRYGVSQLKNYRLPGPGMSGVLCYYSNKHGVWVKARGPLVDSKDGEILHRISSEPSASGAAIVLDSGHVLGIHLGTHGDCNRMVSFFKPWLYIRNPAIEMIVRIASKGEGIPIKEDESLGEQRDNIFDREDVQAAMAHMRKLHKETEAPDDFEDYFDEDLDATAADRLRYAWETGELEDIIDLYDFSDYVYGVATSHPRYQRLDRDYWANKRTNESYVPLVLPSINEGEESGSLIQDFQQGSTKTSFEPMKPLTDTLGAEATQQVLSGLTDHLPLSVDATPSTIKKPKSRKSRKKKKSKSSKGTSVEQVLNQNTKESGTTQIPLQDLTKTMKPIESTSVGHAQPPLMRTNCENPQRELVDCVELLTSTVSQLLRTMETMHSSAPASSQQ
jgi:hypothetical protein